MYRWKVFIGLFATFISCKPTDGKKETHVLEQSSRYDDFPSADLSDCFIPELPETSDSRVLGSLSVARRPVSDCPTVTLPRLCHGDLAPPRILIGPMVTGATAVSGITAELVTLDGREVVKVEMVGTQDFDFEEECPIARSFLTVLLNVHDDHYLNVCEMWVDWTERSLEGGGVYAFRQTHLDDRRFCFFDPEAYELSAKSLRDAMNRDGVGIAVLGTVVDGAGNGSNIFLGEGIIDSSTCGFHTLRDDPSEPARIESRIPCGTGCATDLHIVPISSQITLEPSFTVDPGDYIVHLARPVVTVRHRGRVQTSTGTFCDDLVVHAWVSSLSGGGVQFIRSKPALCEVQLLGDEYETVCVLDADSVEFEASQGVNIVAEIAVLARTRDEHVTYETQVSGTFR